MTYTIQELKNKNFIIYAAIMGSHAYGTALPESDTDIRGIFIQPLEDALKYGWVDQVADETNDTIYYELGRFIHLLMGNNPNILELLSAPDDCVLVETDEFKYLKSFKNQFLTKKVRYTFAGYAIDQIKKARGYNKKMNWEEANMERKSVLDFCYVLVDGGSMSFKNWIKSRRLYEDLTQEDFGLANIDHAHDIYAMYLKPANNEKWGIVSDEEKANDVQLTSIPKNLDVKGYLYFNKDGYSTHCTRYKEYQTWLKERNPHRIKMNKEHGKNYDSKNMNHCIRLLDMALDILEKGEVIVRRPKEHIDLLMSIRRGEMEYETILTMAESKIAMLDEKTEQSKLPDSVDQEFAQELLLKIRKSAYKL